MKNDNHGKNGEKFVKCGIKSKCKHQGFRGQYWTSDLSKERGLTAPSKERFPVEL